MKNVLFATSAIVAFTAGGVAFADSHAGGISLSGDARLGLLYDDSADNEIVGTSRARVKFTASGTSDNGLTFGMNFRADNAGGAKDQAGSGSVSSAGEVFIGGSFGTLTYQDTDSALKKRFSNVDAISLTGLGDAHEIFRGSQGDNGARIRYDYDFDSFGVSISTLGELDTISVGVGGTVDLGGTKLSVGLGYDNSQTVAVVDDPATAADETAAAADNDTIAVSVGAEFGSIAVKAAYSTADATGDGMALSAKYTSGPLSVAAFVQDADANADMAFGVGLGYDMGGGLELKTGVVSAGNGDLTADLGFAMSF